ncbi:MAG TPA: hypothetical protein VMI11_07145 [Actinomycetes bacterium]|nr:hypothetical protein [Actinomycetes bacterium]
MRHARTGADVEPAVAPAEVAVGPAAPVDPLAGLWAWPEAPGLPPAQGPDPVRLPAADQPRPSGPRHGSTGAGPTPAQRYPRSVDEPAPVSAAALAPVAAAGAAVLGTACWLLLARLTGGELAALSVVVGGFVGASIRVVGGRADERNVYCAVLFSLLASVTGFTATAVQSRMSELDVGWRQAIAGSRWNDLVTGIGTSPLHWGLAALAVGASLAVVSLRAQG